MEMEGGSRDHSRDQGSRLIRRRSRRPWPDAYDLPAVARKKLTVDFDGGNQSSDAGLLLLRAAEKKVGVCARLGSAMRDRRDPTRVRHAIH